MERMANGQAAPGTMRAWRTHEYGPRPTEVLQLDTVPIPEPQAGEVRVRVQAIPLNLNDLERITGGFGWPRRSPGRTASWRSSGKTVRGRSVRRHG